MTTLVLESEPLAASLEITGEWLSVHLVDGRRVAVPLGWYPRLAHGSPAERSNWELIADGEGIHWPDLDEDISIAGIIAGRKSGESEHSFQRWLQARQAALAVSSPKSSAN
jgi:hypothetical protein